MITTAATRDRIIAEATAAFAERGVAATSLDGLAGELGVTKQTILYHFGSKDGLIDEVFLAGTDQLSQVLERAVDISDPGWDRVEATVRAAFSLAVRRPHLVGLLREAGRLGPPVSDVVLARLQPLADGAIDYLRNSMRSDSQQRSGSLDPRLVVVTAYSMITGVIADSEVLRAVGAELDLRVAVGLRRTLLSFLAMALTEDRGVSGSPLT